MRQVGGIETWYTQDPYPPGRQQTNRRIFTIAEVLSKERGVQVPHQAPQIGVLHWEDEPPDCLAFKTSIAYFQKAWGATGNRQIFTHFGIQGRGKNLKGAWVRCTSDRQSQSQSHPEEEEAMEAHSMDTDTSSGWRELIL